MIACKKLLRIILDLATLQTTFCVLYLGYIFRARDDHITKIFQAISFSGQYAFCFFYM